MAADAALLDRASESGGAFLRLYRWDPPTLSVGRNQRIAVTPRQGARELANVAEIGARRG